MNLRDTLRKGLDHLTRRARPYDLADALALDGAELDRWLRDREVRRETVTAPRVHRRARPTRLVDAA